jgi:hypothetical protein
MDCATVVVSLLAKLSASWVVPEFVSLSDWQPVMVPPTAIVNKMAANFQFRINILTPLTIILLIPIS